jgi:hypothetical protein
MSRTGARGSISLLVVLAGLCAMFSCVEHKPLGLSCPCAPGWTCRNEVCVPTSSTGAGGNGAAGVTGAGGDSSQAGTNGSAGNSSLAGNFGTAGDASLAGTTGTAGDGNLGGTTGAAGDNFAGNSGAGGSPIATSAAAYLDGCQSLRPTANTIPQPLVDGCPCTRRPGRGNSFQCPQGANESASGEILPGQSNQLQLNGQQGAKSGMFFAVDLPPGAFDTAIDMTVIETDLSPPVGFVDYSPIYRVGPVGLSLLKLATLRIPISNTANVPPNALVYEGSASDPCNFEPIADTVINAGVVQASMTKTGFFFVGVPKTAAQASCP